MKLRNWRRHVSGGGRYIDRATYLKERVLFLALELVRTEKTDTTLRLFVRETLVVALKELEDIIDDDGLEVDLLLVVEVFRLELDLGNDRG